MKREMKKEKDLRREMKKEKEKVLTIDGCKVIATKEEETCTCTGCYFQKEFGLCVYKEYFGEAPTCYKKRVIYRVDGEKKEKEVPKVQFWVSSSSRPELAVKYVGKD